MTSVIAESTVSATRAARHASSGGACDDSGPQPPRSPGSPGEAGLTVSQLSDFILKALYLNGGQAGHEIGRELRLPFGALEDAVLILKGQRCLEITAGQTQDAVFGQYELTEAGRVRARDALRQCRYIGPAPVSLSSYAEQCRIQTPDRIACFEDQFREFFQHLVLPPKLLAELGTAVCGGHSVLLYGPPGNGKTVIAKAVGEWMRTCGGEIYVPYSVLVENSVVTIFDPAVHQSTDEQDPDPSSATAGSAVELESGVDRRWRRIRRPVVIAGGDLTLDMLDLRRHVPGGYFSAPLQLKANGGLFVMDDLGRQAVSPRELINRWILPLEEGFDRLTLAEGNRVAVPFQQLLMFSTHLNLHDVFEEGLLRRIRHRIAVSPPSRDVFEQIFHNCCRLRDFDFDRRHVDALFERHYNRQRLPRSSDPHDLLEGVTSECRFRGEEPRLDAELLTIASERFFREL